MKFSLFIGKQSNVNDNIQTTYSLNNYLHILLNMMEQAKAVPNVWILMTLYIQGRYTAGVS